MKDEKRLRCILLKLRHLFQSMKIKSFHEELYKDEKILLRGDFNDPPNGIEKEYIGITVFDLKTESFIDIGLFTDDKLNKQQVCYYKKITISEDNKKQWVTSICDTNIFEKFFKTLNYDFKITNQEFFKMIDISQICMKYLI